MGAGPPAAKTDATHASCLAWGIRLTAKMLTFKRHLASSIIERWHPAQTQIMTEVLKSEQAEALKRQNSLSIGITDRDAQIITDRGVKMSKPSTNRHSLDRSVTVPRTTVKNTLGSAKAEHYRPSHPVNYTIVRRIVSTRETNLVQVAQLESLLGFVQSPQARGQPVLLRHTLGLQLRRPHLPRLAGGTQTLCESGVTSGKRGAWGDARVRSRSDGSRNNLATKTAVTDPVVTISTASSTRHPRVRFFSLPLLVHIPFGCSIFLVSSRIYSAKTNNRPLFVATRSVFNQNMRLRR